jgi:hypothetical protein
MADRNQYPRPGLMPGMALRAVSTGNISNNRQLRRNVSGPCMGMTLCTIFLGESLPFERGGRGAHLLWGNVKFIMTQRQIFH